MLTIFCICYSFFFTYRIFFLLDFVLNVSYDKHQKLLADFLLSFKVILILLAKKNCIIQNEKKKKNPTKGKKKKGKTNLFLVFLLNCSLIDFSATGEGKCKSRTIKLTKFLVIVFSSFFMVNNQTKEYKLDKKKRKEKR